MTNIHFGLATPYAKYPQVLCDYVKTDSTLIKKTSGYATWFTAAVQSASLIMTSLMTS